MHQIHNVNFGASTSRLQNVTNNTSHNSNANLTDEEISEIYGDSILQMLDEPFDLLIDRSKLRTDANCFGFDNNTGDSWIYPTNYPIRQYQFNITKQALYKNTLVALPTGLGKTFIAAVVMYNIYRWYPMGKIIFMAPTRPLVTQQIEACYNIMGIPKSDTAELTGKQNKQIRQVLWQKKRVFFATPQTIQSDLNSEENFPFSTVRLIVIDEAHKAKGKYAYTEVVQSIANRNRFFRVLALSATPGRHIEDVVEVVRNLLISHVEIRWENSIDVSPYVHKKSIKTEVVPLGEKLIRIRDEFIQLVDKYVRPLVDNDIVHGSIGSLTKTTLLMQQKRFREVVANQQMSNYSQIMSNFSTSISLYHALDLLEKHGLRIFLNFFDDETNTTGEKYFIAKDWALKRFLARLREEVGPNPFAISDETLPDGSIVEMPANLDFGHPKFKILERNLCEHFTANEGSRAIIFCEFRESVLLVHRLLLQNRPLIRPKFIVGKGGTSIGIRAVTEKQQKSVMTAFREGTVNTLIATCVAEEGIDVGEVDLIICFDINTKNPTRFVQRIGRTGRKRQGRVIMLVTQGHEQDVLKDVMANKDKTNQKIAKSNEIIKNLYKNCPRLVPTEFDPKCIETHIKIPVSVQDESEEVRRRKTTTTTTISATNTVDKVTKKSPKNSKNMTKMVKPRSRDVRDFFKKVDPTQNTEAQNDFDDFSIPRNILPLEQNQIVIDDDYTHGNKSNPATKVPSSNLLKSLIKDQKQLIKTIRNPPKRQPPIKPPPPIEYILSPENQLPDQLRRDILEWCEDFIKIKLEAGDVLDAVAQQSKTLDTEDDDVLILEPEVLDLQRDLNKINEIFGGRPKVQDLVLNFKEMKRFLSAMKSKVLGRKFNLPVADARQFIDGRDLVLKLKVNLDGLRFELMNKYDPYGKFETGLCATPNLESINLLIETQDDHHQIDRVAFNYISDNVILNTSSSYVDLLAPPPVKQSIAMVSTPIAKFNERLKRSTPVCVENSPLMRAFNRSIEKRLKLNTSSPLFSVDKSCRSTLEFFGLCDFDEIFECSTDDDDHFEIPVTPPPSTSRFSRKLFQKIEPPKQNIERLNSQCTVTQLLNIIDSFAEPVDSNRQRLNIVHQKQQQEHQQNDKFDLGELDAIFGSDDDDMFADCDVDEIPNSPDTQEYNVDECIDNVDSKQMGLQIKLASPKAIFREKSSELFDQSVSEMKITKALKSPPRTTMENTQNAERVDILQRSPSVLFNRRTNFNKLRSKISQLSSTNGVPSSNMNSDTSTRSEFFVTAQDQQKMVELPADQDHSQIPVTKTMRRKRVIESSDSSDESTIFETCVSNKKKTMFVPVVRAMPKKRRKCIFIDDEAALDGDHDSEDEIENTQSQQAFYQNTIIDHSIVEDDPSVDMHAVYLRSVKSPVGRHQGRFKIPDRKKFQNISNIFSQFPEVDDEDGSLDDSFVVEEDDANHIEEVDKSMCPLERAEAILKARRKEKRKGLTNAIEHRNGNVIKRRKKIIHIDLDTSSSSDGNDDS